MKTTQKWISLITVLIVTWGLVGCQSAFVNVPVKSSRTEWLLNCQPSAQGYIYYSDGNSVRRMKPDGSGDEAFTDFFSEYWFTVDDWVYYTDRCHYPEFTDNDIQAPVLHRRKEDGTQDTRVAELPIAAATCESCCLYYQPDSHYGSGLYRTRPNGSEAQQIYDEPINRFYFDGGCLYILDPYGLLRLSTDGSTRERIIDSSEYSAVGISDISFDDKCIYYLADLPGDWLNNQYLYRVNKDGSQKVQLTQTTTRAYAVSGDSVYFVGGDSSVSDQHLYRLTKTDHQAAMVSWRRVDSDRDSLLYDGTFLYVYFIDGTEHDDCMGDSWETSHLYKIKCDK